jgi:hydantoinase/carbamoylase family amidase
MRSSDIAADQPPAPSLPSTVAASLDEVAKIGRDRDGSVTRLAWTSELFEAYRWVGDRMCALGLEVRIDAAGNLLGQSDVGTGRAVLVGSHLDTVPRGGRFDGALGVISALHALRALKDEGLVARRPLWIAAFMDEEGVRFGTPMFGSRAFVGADVSNLRTRADATGVRLDEAMARAGLSFDAVESAACVDDVDEYIELHVEQGPLLEAEHLDVGIVTSIVGLCRLRVCLVGEQGHAGTTPMSHRRDALVAASRITVWLRDAALARKAVTATVGSVEVDPGAANVIPGRAQFTIDVRAADRGELRGFRNVAREAIQRIAGEEGVACEVEQTVSEEPAQLDAALADVVDRAASSQGASTKRMTSGAGHDAMALGRRVPACMLFIPSLGGISHSPREFTRPDDVELGMRVLTAVLRERLRDR